MPLSIYLHIPFCISKCLYCDFVSGYKPNEKIIDDYISSLCKEMCLFTNKHPIRESIFTIYLGGGTPSLLKPGHLKKVFETLQKNFIIQSKENTIEVNPEDVTKEKATLWREIGFNRISLGFQSMNNSTLTFLGRRNSKESNINAFEILREKGFNNINIDLIASIRGDSIRKSIAEILKLRPEHISAYELSIEEGSGLYQKWKDGKYKSLSTQASLKNYRIIQNELTSAGYIHYEISNYAISKELFSIHNMNYWNYGAYLGFGLGSSGFIKSSINATEGGYRWTNTKNIKTYIKKIKNNLLPVGIEEKIDKKKAIKEYIMVGLRKIEGINIEEMKFSLDIDPLLIFSTASSYIPKNMILLEKEKIRLTPQGIFLLNPIIQKIWDIVDKLL